MQSECMEQYKIQFKLFIKMSSYIIAGSADSLDTAYCQQIARRIKAKYKNIDFRVVIKHPSQWQEYLNQICRIYGFLKKSNPIIYTYHGKIIGNKDAFVNNTSTYFGLGQQLLIVKNLSTAVNVKLANQQIERKKILKNNIKTLQQKIIGTYQKLLKQGALKHQFKSKSQFLVNGIQYFFKEVPGVYPSLAFPQNFDIPVQKQNIETSKINLMELSLQDQITPEEVGKQPFVTNQNNQVLNTESMQKMSEASRTNKLQSSVMSKDQDSKVIRESNRQKQKIDEQVDDVPDYNNINMEKTLICQLGDHFCLAFQPKTYIPGQMVLYYNEAQNNGNSLRIYNDRPVIGHHTIIKQIHYIGQVQQSYSKNIESQTLIKQESEQRDQNQSSKKEEDNKSQSIAEKSKTQPNIQQNNQKKKEFEEQALSEPCSDLNLVSNLNYHTLYLLKPLSSMEIRYLLYLIKETNSVGCLQFLPQNPNPKIKVYSRHMLLDTNQSLFPVEQFIEKQLQDHAVEHVTLPRQQHEHQEIPKINFLKINNLDFSHLYFPHPQKLNEEELFRVLKVAIDQTLFLEEHLKKYIGYNLIITKKYTLIVALASPYKIYGQSNLYFDGLAYLGYILIPKLVEGYKLKQQKIDSGKAISSALAQSSAFEQND